MAFLWDDWTRKMYEKMRFSDRTRRNNIAANIARKNWLSKTHIDSNKKIMYQRRQSKTNWNEKKKRTKNGKRGKDKKLTPFTYLKREFGVLNEARSKKHCKQKWCEIDRDDSYEIDGTTMPPFIGLKPNWTKDKRRRRKKTKWTKPNESKIKRADEERREKNINVKHRTFAILRHPAFDVDVSKTKNEISKAFSKYLFT